jgi:hypothetical protein
MVRHWLVAAVFIAVMGGAVQAQTAEPAPAAPQESAAPTSGPAPTETPAPVATDTAAQAPVCRSIKVTGSRLGARRVCKSQQQWELEAEAARTTAGERQRRAVNGTSGG